PADKSYIIKSIKIGPTTYELGSIKYAKNGCKALNEEGDYLTLVITADNDNKVEVDLARDGNLLEDWTEVDLTELGFVNELSFSIKGSDTSYGWLNSPSYFAFDDVVVDLVSKPEVEELKEK
ncbi:MAG: DUF4465 domain-containing protein, partial [Bacteroidaceae bacterium]|nr:DUF4465 domain-containing protein [Bacteroidaceae bacterium]